MLALETASHFEAVFLCGGAHIIDSPHNENRVVRATQPSRHRAPRTARKRHGQSALQPRYRVPGKIWKSASVLPATSNFFIKMALRAAFFPGATSLHPHLSEVSFLARSRAVLGASATPTFLGMVPTA